MITQIVVPAARVAVDQIVDNRNAVEPLVVTSVEAFGHFGEVTYHIAISRGDCVVYTVELKDGHSLTYTYESEGTK